MANVFYYYGKAATPFLRDRLLVHLGVAGSDGETILDALRWGMNDFEDALQAAAARTVGASFIISRNVRDFKFSKVPAITPSDFIKRFH